MEPDIGAAADQLLLLKLNADDYGEGRGGVDQSPANYRRRLGVQLFVFGKVACAHFGHSIISSNGFLSCRRG